MYFFRNYKATGLYIYIYIDGFFMIRKRRDIHFFTLYFTARALSQVASLWLGSTGISREFKNVNERRIVGRVEFCLIKAGSGSSANFFSTILSAPRYIQLSLYIYIEPSWLLKFISIVSLDSIISTFLFFLSSIFSLFDYFLFFLDRISKTNKQERWNIFNCDLKEIKYPWHL